MAGSDGEGRSSGRYRRVRRPHGRSRPCRRASGVVPARPRRTIEWQTLAMSDSPSFRLEEIPVHLGLGATVVPQAPFTGEMDWYQSYAEQNAADGVEGRLVTMHTFSEPWDS